MPVSGRRSVGSSVPSRQGRDKNLAEVVPEQRHGVPSPFRDNRFVAPDVFTEAENVDLVHLAPVSGPRLDAVSQCVDLEAPCVVGVDDVVRSNQQHVDVAGGPAVTSGGGAEQRGCSRRRPPRPELPPKPVDERGPQRADDFDGGPREVLAVCHVEVGLTRLGDVDESLFGEAGEYLAYSGLASDAGKFVYLPARERLPSARQGRENRRVEGWYQGVSVSRARDVYLITSS